MRLLVSTSPGWETVGLGYLEGIYSVDEGTVYGILQRLTDPASPDYNFFFRRMIQTEAWLIAEQEGHKESMGAYWGKAMMNNARLFLDYVRRESTGGFSGEMKFRLDEPHPFKAKLHPAVKTRGYENIVHIIERLPKDRTVVEEWVAEIGKFSDPEYPEFNPALHNEIEFSAYMIGNHNNFNRPPDEDWHAAIRDKAERLAVKYDIKGILRL